MCRRFSAVLQSSAKPRGTLRNPRISPFLKILLATLGAEKRASDLKNQTFLTQNRFVFGFLRPSAVHFSM